jgi:hypothetical protein
MSVDRLARAILPIPDSTKPGANDLRREETRPFVRSDRAVAATRGRRLQTLAPGSGGIRLFPTAVTR